MRICSILLTIWTGALVPLSAQPPAITNPPVGQAVWAGGNVTLTVGASGNGPFHYQWQIDSINLPNGIITTVAGGGNGGDGSATTNASLNSPFAVAADASGDLFIADLGHQSVRMAGTNGIMTTVAGNGTYGYSGDGGSATNASLAYPDGVAVDATGDLFIADNLNERVRKVSTNGTITTVAGNGALGYSGDGGPATNASMHFPDDVAVDTSGNLFIADTGNRCIREVSTNGTITTVAGNGTPGFSGDGGPATNANLNAPKGVAVDNSGNLFIADWSNTRVRKVSTNGIITTVAGNGTYGYSGDGGPATNASMGYPWRVTVDALGNLFIADYGLQRIRMVNANGIITTVAGNGNNGYYGDGGMATSASLNFPYGVAVDASDNLFIADTDNNRIRKVTPDLPTLSLHSVTAANAGDYQVVVTGSGGSVTSSVATVIVATITRQPASRANVVGTTATFSVAVGGVASSGYQWLKNGLAMTDGGNASGSTADTLTLGAVQHADAASYAVVITNVAGCVTSSLAILTVVDSPLSINTQPASRALWAGGNVTFSAEVSGVGPFTYQWQFNHTNLANGIITTIAGNGTAGYSGDGGPATGASLNGPLGTAEDTFGNLFIADNNNCVIREVNAGGIITTIAGNGTAGHAGNGGAATNANLESPTGVAVDAAGNLFIADDGNNWVRKVDTHGIITTVVGDNYYGYSGDGGPATDASLYQPGGVALDAAGNLFIADTGNQRIRMVDTNGIITTIGGNGTAGYAGDGGPATGANLDAPFGIAVDVAGNVFVAEAGNSVIREIYTNGMITTVAGTGGPVPAVVSTSAMDYRTDSSDGTPATSVSLDRPFGVAVDAEDNVFIADTYNYRISQVNTNDFITRVAGSGAGYPAHGSYSGDGGAATNARLNYPYGVTVDAAGNLFISDTANYRVRKVTNTRGPVLTLNNVTAANAGDYQVVVNGPGSSVTSSVANLTVALSPLIYQTVPNPDGSVSLNFVSQPGSTNVVLCTTNLSPPAVWQPLSTNIAGIDGNWQFTDATAPTSPAKFYRSLAP